jgi:hypothetical protein
MPKIIIQPAMSDGSQQPVRLTINGVETELPVGQEITVTDEQFLALGHTDHNIQITVEGEAAADEIEQAPAPASTGGDAGGGGDSGDAATDILPPDATNELGGEGMTPTPETGEQEAGTSDEAEAEASVAEEAQPEAEVQSEQVPQPEAAQDEEQASGAGAAAQPEAEAPAADDTLELGSGDEVASEASQADTSSDGADPAQSPSDEGGSATGESAEQPAEAQADAGEQAPAEESVADRLEHVIEEEQAIVDELRGQGDQA